MRAHGLSDYFDLQRHGCRPVSCGLLLPPDLTLDDWAAVGRALGRQQHVLRWRIADWWNHGGHSYGERLAIVTAEDWIGPAYSTCTNVASVGGKFETSRRREVLSFSHHAEVAHHSPHLADELLDWCEETLRTTGKPRSVRALREEINRRTSRSIIVGPTRIVTTVVTPQIVLAPAPEPESQRLTLLAVPTAPRHEPEVPQPEPVAETTQFKAFLRYAEKQLPADATAATLAVAIDETKALLARLGERLRQSGGDPDDNVVVNLR